MNIEHMFSGIYLMLTIIGMGVFGFGQGFMNCMIQTTQPDIVDELAVKTGSHNPGLVMAMFSLACQIGGGVGNSLVTAILDIGGFVGDAPVQSASAITAIKVAFGGIALVAFALIIISMSMYDGDKKFPEIQAKLAEMRKTKES